MTQEERQLLLIALCEYLPYKVKCFAEDREFGDLGTLYSIDPFEKIDPNIYIQYDKGNVISFFTSEVKPYLRPMSSMTEEEKKELGILECEGNIEHHYGIFYRCQDWLNSHYFDYRGLIEKNLALDCTGLHIYD